MIRRTALAGVALLSLFSLNSFAHEGHDDESLSEKEAAQLASKTLPSLVQAKKVGASWAKAKQDKVELRSLADQNVWVISYTNPESQSGGAEKLYLLFDDLGNFLQANHTGEMSKK